MNATVITTGPGVIQPGREEGPGQQCRGRRRHRRTSAPDERRDSGEQKEPDDLGLGPRRDQSAHDEDDPRDGVLERAPRQLPRAPGDDRDHGCADAVERSLHPPDAAILHVGCGQDEDHHERWQNEGCSDQRRPERAGLEPAQVDRQLGSERARSELRQGEALEVFLLREPASSLDEVTLHVAHERDRPAESEGAQLEKVADEIRQRVRCAFETRLWLLALSRDLLG